ncbi:MAG: hypothetical protein RLZZ350_534 [Verrucomicrobiota bacterium]
MLGALVLVLYSPALRYEFLNYDDQQYVADNAAVRAGLNWSGVKYAFTSTDGALGAPLTWLSFMADTSLLGARASSYHATNVLLHAVGAALAFLVFETLLNAFWPALLVAALFALHPLRTESVAWITERKDVLFGIFWLLGLWAHQRHVVKPSAGKLAVVVACFALGLLAKFMMVTFPFVLLLLDFWPLQRCGKNLAELRARLWPVVREKIPLFLLAAVSVVLMSRVQQHTLHTDTGLLAKLPRVFANYAFYFGKIFWPTPRSILYPLGTVNWLAASIGGALLLGGSALALVQMWRRPWLLVGWFWFVGTFTPVVGFVTFSNFFVADRYTYLPSLGLEIIVVCAACEFARRSVTRAKLAASMGATLVCACAFATHCDLPRWENSITLFTAAAQTGPHPAVFLNLSSAHNVRGEYALTIRYATRSLELEKSGDAFNNRANAYAGLGQWTNALTDFNAALALNPALTEAYVNRAFVYASLGEREHARADCDRALAINPRAAQAYNTRGNVLLDLGEARLALADFNAFIALRPELPMGYNNRAGAWLALKDFANARADMEHCRQLGGTVSEDLVKQLAAAEPAKNR